MLAVCHTVMCEPGDGKIKYQASSPDELALTMGGNQIGFELINRTKAHIIIQNHINSKKE